MSSISSVPAKRASPSAENLEVKPTLVFELIDKFAVLEIALVIRALAVKVPEIAALPVAVFESTVTT
jgi:hypothetical protein